MASQKPTKDDHFVSRGYLKKFSIDPNAKNPFIYQFDVDEKAEHKDVPISSICFESRLYEVYDVNGNIIVENAIEHSIKKIEDAFYIVRNNILQKLFIANRKEFLSYDERNKILAMIVLQLLRTKDVLKNSKEIMTQMSKTQSDIPEHIKDIISKIACLPMHLNYDGIEMTRELRAFRNWANNPPVLYNLIKMLHNYNMCLGYNDNANLFICDRPVVVRTCNTGTIDLIIYPISTKHVVYVYSKETPFPHKHNSIFEMKQDEVSFVNREVIVNAIRWVYSNKKLTEQEISKIKQIRNEINKNLVKNNRSSSFLFITKDKKEKHISFDSKLKIKRSSLPIIN